MSSKRAEQNRFRTDGTYCYRCGEKSSSANSGLHSNPRSAKVRA
jgi:hypothetical protein